MSEAAHVKELLSLSRRLLDAIDGQDWAAYRDLCDPTITAFEPEAVGHLVGGLAFHEFYFQGERSKARKQSTISSPHVRLMGDSAVVSYVRLTQRVDENGQFISGAAEETRVWQNQNGAWKHVHFHRSPIDAR
jgi:calcium/calmodulin-dependent protein kinase (CaM kinase) II